MFTKPVSTPSPSSQHTPSVHMKRQGEIVTRCSKRMLQVYIYIYIYPHRPCAMECPTPRYNHNRRRPSLLLRQMRTFSQARAHSSCAQRSHGSSACKSLSCTVGPHHMRMPAGASLYDAMSRATPSASSNSKNALSCGGVRSVTMQTDVQERVAGAEARKEKAGEL